MDRKEIADSFDRVDIALSDLRDAVLDCIPDPPKPVGVIVRPGMRILDRCDMERIVWPIRMVNGVRLCAREGCEDDEFRIDGYCSMECRDVDEVEIEFRAYRADVEPVLRAELAVEAAREPVPYVSIDEYNRLVDELGAAVSASRVCKEIKEGK